MFLDRQHSIAPEGYSRWRVPPAALAIHLSIGQAYAFSVFNLPLSRFSPAQLPKDKPLVLVCLSGARSAAALNQALREGATQVRHYSGGMKGWRANGGAVAI